jgi:hypothetical protein
VELSQRKEQFSKAYLRAVSSVAGFRLSEPSVDDDSVDWTVSGRGSYKVLRSPKLDVQLKCTERWTSRNGYFSFPLEVKNYNDGEGNSTYSKGGTSLDIEPCRKRQKLTKKRLNISLLLRIPPS